DLQPFCAECFTAQLLLEWPGVGSHGNRAIGAGLARRARCIRRRHAAACRPRRAAGAHLAADQELPADHRHAGLLPVLGAGAGAALFLGQPSPGGRAARIYRHRPRTLHRVPDRGRGNRPLRHRLCGAEAHLARQPFRARRYRLSRTAWRGIGTRQTGSAWRYVGIFLLTGLLTVVTLGICAPWNSIACQRYKIANTWFGDSRFSVEAKAKDLLPSWLAVLALLVLPAAVAIGLNHAFFSAAAHVQGQAHPVARVPHPGAFLLFLVTIFAGIPVLIAYWVAQFRYLASRTRLGETRFHSAARGGPVAGRVILVGLALVAIFIVLAGG